MCFLGARVTSHKGSAIFGAGTLAVSWHNSVIRFRYCTLTWQKALSRIGYPDSFPDRQMNAYFTGKHSKRDESKEGKESKPVVTTPKTDSAEDTPATPKTGWMWYKTGASSVGTRRLRVQFLINITINKDVDTKPIRHTGTPQVMCISSFEWTTYTYESVQLWR